MYKERALETLYFNNMSPHYRYISLSIVTFDTSGLRILLLPHEGGIEDFV